MPRYGLQTGAAFMSGIMDAYNRSLSLQADLENYKSKQQQAQEMQQSRDLRDRLAVQNYNLKIDDSILETKKAMMVIANDPQIKDEKIREGELEGLQEKINSLDSMRFMPFADDAPSAPMPLSPYQKGKAAKEGMIAQAQSVLDTIEQVKNTDVEGAYRQAKAKKGTMNLASAKGAAQPSIGRAKTIDVSSLPEPKSEEEFEAEVARLHKSDAKAARAYYDKWVSKW
jgi:ribosome-binding ATPase YchF (GTP1/OBG family)